MTQEERKRAEEILNKHTENDYIFNAPIEQLDRFRNHVFDAMEEYAELSAGEATDALYRIYSRPYEALKPIEDMWRKENSPERFILPDRTEFFKWIAKRMNELLHEEEVLRRTVFDLVEQIKDIKEDVRDNYYKKDD